MFSFLFSNPPFSKAPPYNKSISTSAPKVNPGSVAPIFGSFNYRNNPPKPATVNPKINPIPGVLSGGVFSRVNINLTQIKNSGVTFGKSTFRI
jgi:hypothetical protein